MTWAAVADDLAESLREAGYSAATLNAAAWAAGVMPEATKGLVGAAMALGAPLHSLFAHVDPLRDDKALLAAAQDIEGAVAEMLKQARDLWDRIAEDREMAYRALAAAQAAAAAAETDEESALASSAQLAARMRIADCDAALDILGPAGQRLKYALACLGTVPEDLEGTYEAPYAHVRAGGKLPFEGEWLTGATPVTPRHAIAN